MILGDVSSGLVSRGEVNRTVRSGEALTLLFGWETLLVDVRVRRRRG